MTPMTYSEVLDAAQLDVDEARKTGLILRLAGRPITHQGYMFEQDIQALVFYSDKLPELYDAAERQMRMEERDRDNDPEDPFKLPRDSRVTGIRVARRAARGIDWDALSAVAA